MRIVACVLFVLVCLTPLSSASGETSCDCGIRLEPGESIQDAIDQAPDGSAICLAAGTWRETITIVKSLVLCGSGQEDTFLTGDESGFPSVSIRTPQETTDPIHVTIRDLAIRSTGGGCYDNPAGICANGVAIGGYADVTAESVALSYNGEYGLWVDGHASVKLQDSTVSNNGNDGLQVGQQARLSISRSAIKANRYNGAVAAGASMLELEDCLIQGNGHNGLIMTEATDVSVIRCDIIGNEFCGVCQHTLICPPYGFGEINFWGTLSGYGNRIPGSDRPDGNRLGTSCPETWAKEAGLLQESAPVTQGG